MEKFYSKYLKQIEGKIEKLEHKRDGWDGKKLTPIEFERVLDELKVLKELEEFLWNKLGEE